MDRYLRYILIIGLALIWIIFRAPAWLAGTDMPYLWRALSYSFFHASWLHLAVNCIAIWGIFRPRPACKPCRDLLLSFLIAVLVYPLSFRPVIGFSNILYAVLGMRTPSLSSSWWRRSEVIVFLTVTVLMIFIPQFSAFTHIFSFLAGMGIAALRRFTKKILKDAGHIV